MAASTIPACAAAGGAGFLQHGTDRDPISGANDGTTNVVLPWKPIRYRIKGIPRFVTTRGGGYFFMPSLTALRSKAQWLCPQGHEVLREWEHAHRPEMESNLAIRWWGMATNAAGIGERDEAQLMVRCKA